MKKTFTVFQTLLLAAFLCLIGCQYKSEDELFGVPAPCNATQVTYSATITSIINNNGCPSCHGGSAPIAGFVLTDYSDLKYFVDNGRLWGAINHLPGFVPMPQGGSKLSDCDISKIKAWIDAGAPNN